MYAPAAPCQSDITGNKNTLPWLLPLDSSTHHSGGVGQAFVRKGVLSFRG